MILDVMLPGLSGYRVVRALRAEGHWLPVLMLSAKDGEHDQADGLDCGADDYLTKPFSYVVLLARLRALLRRGAPERPAVLSVGEVALDPASRRVTVAGAEVTLTTREYGLLQYLCAGPARGLQDRAARPRLGRQRGDRAQRGGGLHRLPAAQARPRRAGDGPRGRLPAGAAA